LGSVGSGYQLLEITCQSGNEAAGFMRLGVSKSEILMKYFGVNMFSKK